MLRFAKVLLVFCLIPLPVLYGLHFAVDKGLRHSRSALFSEWNDIYSGAVDADVLIMGSSRAWVHYSPDVFETKTGLSTYNLGLDGWTFPMQKARFDIYLQHNRKPKYIIQNLDNSLLVRRDELYQPEQFLPYLSDPRIRTATSGYLGSFDWPHEHFPLLKYNNQLGLVLEGISQYVGIATVPSQKKKGFQGQNREWDSTFDAFKAANPNGVVHRIDDDVEREFREYLAFCRSNGISVVLVYSPEYIEAQRMGMNRSELMRRYQSIAEEAGVPLIDYSHHALSTDKSYFYNSQHLNARGAEAFSEHLVEQLVHFNLVRITSKASAANISSP